MKLLSEALRVARKKSGLDQHIVAAEIGVSRAAISAWENGKDKVPWKRLEQLATVYGTTVGQLIVGTRCPCCNQLVRS